MLIWQRNTLKKLFLNRIGYYCIFSLCLLTTTVNLAWPENLEQIYQLAVQNDQLFQNATATRQAAAEALPQAMSVLYPNLSGTVNTSMNRQWTDNANPNFDVNGLTANNLHGYQLNLTMPIINFNDWYQVGEAKSSIKAADATYADAAEDLIIRTATAYFEVLKAQDTLENARAQKESLAKQLQQSKARFEVGVDAITSVYNVQAKYDAALAQEISAASLLYATYQNLEVITKKPIDHLSRLVEHPPLPQPTPNNIDTWKTAAESRNFSLLSLRYAADQAQTAIKASNANHLPNLSTVNSYTYVSQSPSITQPFSLKQNTSQIGLLLTVPLFSGGEVSSQTRQAQDVFVEASTSMEQKHREVIANTYQVYANILAGIIKVQADAAAVQSSQSAYESNQAAYQAGTMTIVDVLTSLQTLYQDKQSFSTDKYTYLLNTLQLKRLAGTLTNLDIVAINRYLNNGSTISEDQIKNQAVNISNDLKETLKNKPVITGS